MKIVNICISILFVVLLFWQVQVHLPYQLCQLEHTNLFIRDWDAFLASLQQMGGVVKWVGTWGIQFFDKPVWGVLMFLLPVWGLFAITACVLRRKGKSEGLWIPLAAWLAVAQLFSLYDFNFYWWGAMALCLALGILWVWSFLKPTWVRDVLFIVVIPFIAWWLGSVVLVYVLAGIGLFSQKKRWWQTILLPFMAYGGSIALIYLWSKCPSLMTAVSPMMYFETLLDISFYHLGAWGIAILIWGGCRFLPVIEKKALVVSIGVIGWVLPVYGLLQYGATFRNQSNIDLWRLNHYAYTENWDGILQFLAGKPMNNYLFMNYANMALAEKGELGNLAFNYSPRGINALMVNANSTGSIRMLASDVNYMVGCVAEAQQHAFEAQVTFPTSLGIQTMKRLVKTNLIFGHYAVAEKYLNLIAKTTFHKEWADRYKMFLYNDAAVETDSELGEKRKSLSKQNRFSMFYGWQVELEDILVANPKNEKAMTYLGLSFLLNKDMEGFRHFLDKYYGTESLQQLPVVFQQGVIALFQQEKDKWENYHLSPQVVNLYSQYRDLYFKNQRQPNLKNVMARSFGYTFWYYLMFV
jgi:hypothetical protein